MKACPGERCSPYDWFVQKTIHLDKQKPSQDEDDSLTKQRRTLKMEPEDERNLDDSRYGLFFFFFY